MEIFPLSAALKDYTGRGGLRPGTGHPLLTTKCAINRMLYIYTIYHKEYCIPVNRLYSLNCISDTRYDMLYTVRLDAVSAGLLDGGQRKRRPERPL